MRLISILTHRTVIQPGIQKAADPALQSQLSGYMSQATKVLGDASRTGGAALGGAMRAGGELAKRDLGLDVGDLGATYVEKLTSTRSGAGYSQVGSSSALARQEAGEEDFFSSHLGGDMDRHDSQSSEASPNFGGSYNGAYASGGSGGGRTLAAENPWQSQDAPAPTARSISPGIAGKAKLGATKIAAKPKGDDDWGKWD